MSTAVYETSRKIISNVEKCIVGKRKQLVFSLVSWFSGGHILLEDVPGVAKTMLARGASVTEAALECGFGDPNYFSRVFSKSEGMPPGRWVRIGADSPSARLAP